MNLHSNQMPVYLLSGIFIVLFSISSCVDSSLYSIRSIAYKIHNNQCLIDDLNNAVNEKWENTLQRFANHLPSKIHQDEREKMLSLKNAKLIKMFNTYRNLPDSTKKIIEDMALQDEKHSQEIRKLFASNKKYNKQIDSILLTINSKRHVKLGKDLVKSIKSKNCSYHD